MNLTDLQNPQTPNTQNVLQVPPAPPISPPPPPPPQQRPPRPGAKRPSGEISSDVALRSPLRERKKPQAFNYAKYSKPQEKGSTPPQKPMAHPPPVFSPKKLVSPPVSPKVHSSKSKKRKDRHHRHHQKEKENPESSKDDSVQDSGGNGKSPLPTAKSPAAPSPSGSDPEGQPDVEKTSSPIVCFIRFCYYTTFIGFVAALIFWFMAVANALHFTDIEFMESIFMGTQD